MSVRARYWSVADDGRVRCELCPRDCRLQEGQRGFCFVRMRGGDELRLTTYGRSSGFCVDPIEKKPLAHFHPGSSVLSFGTAGCNLGCRFCQNHEISKSRETDRLADEASPEAIAAAAARLGCRSVAFTYNDPVIFAEYAMDVADACRARGVASVAVTAGWICAPARAELFAKMDAANVDLKAFSPRFYQTLTASSIEPVKETIAYLVHETDVWVELTTLLIPGENDSDAELEELSAWVAGALGPDVPLHFSAFHPDHRMREHPPTPASTLRRARAIAKRHGLHHVYCGNVHDREADATYCPSCGAAAIERDWYEVLAYRVDARGACSACGAQIAGRWSERAGSWGRRRLPVAIGSS